MNDHEEFCKNLPKKMERWLEEGRQDAISTCVLYFPKKFVEKAEGDREYHENSDRLPGLTGLLGSNKYPNGAERYIFEKVRAIKTEETFPFGDYEIPRFRISDKDIMFMSHFLGCSSEYSENCYSILRYLSKDSRPIGFSARELRSCIFKLADPMRSLLL